MDFTDMSDTEFTAAVGKLIEATFVSGASNLQERISLAAAIRRAIFASCENPVHIRHVQALSLLSCVVRTVDTFLYNTETGAITVVTRDGKTEVETLREYIHETKDVSNMILGLAVAPISPMAGDADRPEPNDVLSVWALANAIVWKLANHFKQPMHFMCNPANVRI